MAKGYVAFILHAHLPYVRHPEHDNFLEERWLYEAISETYLPLIDTFERLKEEGAVYCLTMSITPTLLTMLADPLLQERYICYLNRLIELSEKEIQRTADQPEFNRLAIMYNKKYRHDLHVFRDQYRCNIINAFKSLQKDGCLELIACAATHGFLPLMGVVPESIKAQIGIGIQTFDRYFGFRPRGIWLPECGYIPAVEKALKENDIEYFIVESHGVLFSEPRPVFGTYTPIVTPNGIAVFARDVESSKQVWSASEGYPGDFGYREYYRDIGYDLDYEYMKDYLLPGGERIHTGIKYFRITGKSQQKEPYNPDAARDKAEAHAEDFLSNRQKQIEFLDDKMDVPPIIVCPYDAELFGHWWYEGPSWLYFLFKKMAAPGNHPKLTTPGRYLDENPVMQVSSPCTSSWGSKGYNEIWLNNTNEWIYRHLIKAASRMVELANANSNAWGISRDALNQAARELLLAQSSDWAFIMKAGTMPQYAARRTQDHIVRFTRLYHDIKEKSIDEAWLRDIEYKDSIFPDIDYRVYASG